jgi:hypothetical protein
VGPMTLLLALNVWTWAICLIAALVIARQK